MGTALVLAFFLAVCGLIAYLGDLTGRRFGKRRLSLFGLRPRHTAIVITVVTGVLIAAASLTFAFIVSNDVRIAVLRGERLLRDVERLQSERRVQSGRLQQEQARNAQLRAESDRLAAQNRDLAARNGALATENARLEGENRRLLAANRTLRRQNEHLTRANATLRKTVGRMRQDLFAQRTTLRQLEDRNRELRTDRDRLNADLAGLRSRLESTQRQLASAQSELDSARAGLASARGELDRVQGQVATLTQQLASLREANDRLHRMSESLMAQNAALERQVETARANLRDQEAKLAEARAAVAQAEAAARTAEDRVKTLQRLREMLETRVLRYQVQDLIFSYGQEVARRPIPAAAPAHIVRGALENLLFEADYYAAQRGARPQTPGGPNVLLDEVIVQEEVTGELRTLTAREEILAHLEREVMQIDGAVLLRAIANVNVPKGAAVPVRVMVAPMRLAVRKGEPVGETILNAADDGRYLWRDLLRFLQEDVRLEAVRLGIEPGAQWELVEAEWDALMEAVQRVRGQRRGLVRVRAVAKYDTWTSGPLEVEFQVESVRARPANDRGSRR